MKDLYISQEQLDDIESASQTNGHYRGLLRSLNIERDGLITPLSEHQLEQMRAYAEQYQDGEPMDTIILEVVQDIQDEET